MRKRFGIWILVVLSIFMVGLVSYFVVPSKDILKKNENVLGSNIIDYRNIPYITSIPIQSLYIGELFRYFVEVSDLDTDEVDIFLNEKPEWMYIEGNEIRGIPLEVGTYKFVVTASDGVNSSSQVNYVLVQDYE